MNLKLCILALFLAYLSRLNAEKCHGNYKGKFFSYDTEKINYDMLINSIKIDIVDHNFFSSIEERDIKISIIDYLNKIKDKEILLPILHENNIKISLGMYDKNLRKEAQDEIYININDFFTEEKMLHLLHHELTLLKNKEHIKCQP